MKIKPLTEAARFINRIREKPDAEGRQQGQSRDHREEKPKSEEMTPEQVEKKLGEALSAFQSDAQTRANGLTADVVGRGPGLKVVLRDGTGVVVRQFTGDEFIRLREAASTDGRKQGKILDQKL